VIAHTDLQYALRKKLQTLLVCTTGSVALSATATGYARAGGSFLVDGFQPGMEVAPSGFTFNLFGTITAVTDLTMTIAGGRTAEVAAGGRSVIVGLPSQQVWENRVFTPTTGAPYVEEQYIPGPKSLDSIGPNGIVTLEPMYSPRIYVPSNTNIGADGRYADAIEALFAPRTLIPLPTGELLYVRGTPAPFRGQRAPSAAAGWSCIPITIPCRVQTTNTI
jgi:hypothetical protein